MWRLTEKVLQISLLTATVTGFFVVCAIVVSMVRPVSVPVHRVDPAEAWYQITVASQHDVRRLFSGQPLVVDLQLLDLRARNGGAPPRQDSSSGVPWIERIQLSIVTLEGATVLGHLDWTARLLPSGVATSNRLGQTQWRTTYVLDGPDLADLPPGHYFMTAALPPDLAPPDRVAVTPLDIEMRPQPSRDVDRAVVSLAIARVAALKGQPARAVEAALTALALDPLQDEALAVAAEGWEQQGDLERAIEWYERYFDTLPASASEQRRVLEEYIEALRRQ